VAKRTVLIVDDDPATCEIVQMALEDEGYRVLRADDEQGIAAALLEKPDVILLDVFLPVIDSTAVSRRLRADVDTSTIPIIVMSAAGETVMGRLDADEHLAKPFDLDDLAATVRRWAPNPLA
jgi:CheY-like chemotaxis protein